MDSLGFTASQSTHSDLTVKSEVNNGRPVMMTGYKVDIPQPLDTMTINGHCWVCDGTLETIVDQITYYTENQPYGAGTFTQGMYSISSPGIIGGIVSSFFHMNWGGTGNGWYAYNNVNSPGGNYQYLRKDIIVIKPD